MRFVDEALENCLRPFVRREFEEILIARDLLAQDRRFIIHDDISTTEGAALIALGQFPSKTSERRDDFPKAREAANPI